MSPDIAMTAASLIETPQGLLRSWAERLSHCRFVTREAVEDAPIVVEVFAGRVLDQTCRLIVARGWRDPVGEGIPWA
jgi:hypothetical protein